MLSILMMLTPKFLCFSCHPAISCIMCSYCHFAVSCIIWEGREAKKISLSPLDIAWSIVENVDKTTDNCDFVWFGMLMSMVIMLTPVAFQFYHQWDQLSITDEILSLTYLANCCCDLIGQSWR